MQPYRPALRLPPWLNLTQYLHAGDPRRTGPGCEECYGELFVYVFLSVMLYGADGLTGDLVFETAWFGAVPFERYGVDYKIGAVRSFWYEGENGEGFELDEVVRSS